MVHWLLALTGLNAVVFTAGIGENGLSLRESVCQDVRWLGLMIARHTWRLLDSKYRHLDRSCR